MFTVCFLSSAVRCQPLSRALCKAGKIGIILFLRSLKPSFRIVGKIRFFCPDSLPNLAVKHAKICELPHLVSGLVRGWLCRLKVWKGQG
ncbi:hypothetical protein EAY40_17855 [Vibrio anguillarum]|nr:hypothetical protein [Vibrio anguillarum]